MFRPFLLRLALLAIVACPLASAAALTNDYDQRRARAVASCEAIDAAKFQTGLLFNPDGYRSYYVRAECFQDAAVLYRDEALCAQARQRRSLFWSSWGVAPARCRELVRKGLEADRAQLEEMRRLYLAAPLTIQRFQIERNGNGRDFDIIPTFGGAYAHGYQLTFEILDPDAGRQPALLHSNGYYVSANANMRLFVRQSDVRQQLPDLVPRRAYPVRATMTLDVGNGGPAGYWSTAFVERIFPVRERSQSITQNVQF